MARSQALKLVTFEPSSLVRSFIREYQGHSSPKTVAFYRDQVEHAFLGWLSARGIREIRDVTPDVVRDYLAEQAAGELSNWSRVSRYRCAKRFLTWCVDNDYLAASPMAKIRQPKLKLEVRYAFTRDDIKRLRLVLDAKPGWIGVRDRTIITVLLGTGARAGELFPSTFNPRGGLRFREIDWQNRRVLLHGKGGRDRYVKLGKGSFRALRDWRDVRPDVPGEDRVFVNQRARVFNYAAAEMMVRTLGELAAVKPCNLHRFRHTFATEYYLANLNLLALKAELGHESPEITMRYLQRLGVNYGADSDARTPDEWL